MIRQKSIIAALAVTASALFAAILVYVTASRVNSLYYSLHPFIGDTSSFFYAQFKLYFDSAVRAKPAVIWQMFLDNPKNPLGYLHYLIFPRSFLLSMNSHLVFTAASFSIFSALLAWAVYQRTNSLIYGMTAPFFIFCAEGLFDPGYQLPSKLSDPPAAFIFGAAVLCVVNSKQGRSLPWLAAFGLFAGLTLLSRFTASGYLFFAVAPVLLLYFWLRWRDKDYGLNHVMWSLVAIGIPLAAVAGWHFVTHVRGVVYFYSVAGSSLNQGLMASIEFTLFKFMLLFLGGLGLAAPILVAGFYAITHWSRRVGTVDLAVTVWMAVAVPLIIVGILRVEDDGPQLAFGLAGYLLFALTPFSIVALSQSERQRLTGFATVVATALVPATAYAVFKRPYAAYVYNLDPQSAQLAAGNRKMAEYALNRQRQQEREQVIDASFDYHWRHLQPTALYAFGILLRTERQFEIREVQWSLAYGNKTPEEITKTLTNSYNARTDILYLLAEPRSERSMLVTKDDFTATVSQGVLDWVRMAPGWTMLGTVEIQWGTVEVWANGNRR